ncbi:uncharacterized protein WM277_020758 [Molossus nigricans]
MANMADIKTPLCALQPTPAIPHTASRSGAGTRGGRARARTGASPERASRQPPAPAGRVGRAWLLEAPALRGPQAAGLAGGPGLSDAGAHNSGRHSLPAHVHFPRERRWLTGEGAEQLSVPARLSERPRREKYGGRRHGPRSPRSGTCPPALAGARGGGDRGPRPRAAGQERRSRGTAVMEPSQPLKYTADYLAPTRLLEELTQWEKDLWMAIATPERREEKVISNLRSVIIGVKGDSRRGEGHGGWSPREHRHPGDSSSRIARKRAEEKGLRESWREARNCNIRIWCLELQQPCHCEETSLT